MKRRKLLLVLALFVVLGVGMAIREQGEGTIRRVSRGTEGSGSESRTFTYRALGETDSITVDVNAQERPEKEAKQLIAEAVAEWDSQYLGKNTSAARVDSSLSLPDTMCGGLVSVAYESSDFALLDTEGNISTEELTEDGCDVELKAEFSYGSYTRAESRTLHLALPANGSRDWLRYRVYEAVRSAESANRDGESFPLPEAVDGQRIEWKDSSGPRWPYVILLGMAVVLCLEWREREKGKQSQKKRNDRLIFEYPQMVEQMSLLLGSGMNISTAWEKMLLTDRQVRREHGGPERVFIEEMWLTHREIREGCGEQQAYERFGTRIGLAPYRRFGAILSQNLMKGTRDVRELLKAEAGEAMELRKNHARRLGEEAGTKLLFPMLLMFVLILLVLLMPAVQNF